MDYTLALGLLAATLTTGAFAPQAIKVIKTKHTKDISLGMFSLMTFGIVCWAVYGILVKDVAVVAANVVSFVLSVIILAYKIRYK